MKGCEAKLDTPLTGQKMRYYAIVHPLSAMKFNSKSRTKKILAATWIIPVLLASPYTFSTSFPFVITSSMGSISRQICNDRFDEIDALMYGPEVQDRFRRGFFIFLFLVIYLIPMVVILATCVRIAICLLQPIAVRRWPPATRKDTGRRHEENKRKVARMVIVVAVAFIVSWSPFYLSTLVSQIQTISGHSFLREKNFLFTMLMIHLCGFLNSCVNPLIYTGMSKKFRRSFKKILGGCICCRLTHRFLRYRDSLTRGMSAAFTSSLRHSMTEVRDANDLALSEAGSSSGAEGSRYSVRSNLNRNSLRNHGGTNSCNLRHSQQQHQRRQNHGRHYNLCQDQAPEFSSSDASPSPKSTKSKSRGFRLWPKSRQQGEVLIQMTPLKGKKKDDRTKNEDEDESLAADKTKRRLNDDFALDEERQKFICEEGQESEPEENETSTRLLSKPSDSFQSGDHSSDKHVPQLRKPSSEVKDQSTDPTVAVDEAISNGSCPAVEKDSSAKRNSNYSAKKDDYCPAVNTGEYLSTKGDGVKINGDGVTINGGTNHILKDSTKDWREKTADILHKDKLNSADLTQRQNVKNSSHSLTNQHDAIVHVGYGQRGQCVEL